MNEIECHYIELVTCSDCILVSRYRLKLTPVTSRSGRIRY